MERQQAERLITRVLGLGKAILPEAELLVSVRSGRAANTRFARSEITSTGDVEEVELQVQAARGRRHATVTMNQTDDASLRTMLQRLGPITRLAPEDPEYMPLLAPQRYKDNPSAYDEATARLGAKDRAAAIASAITQGTAQDLTMSGFYQHHGTLLGLGSSSGLRAFHRATQATFTTTARTADGSGSGWAGGVSHRAFELAPPELVKVAIDKAVRSRRPQALAPGRYTVVLEPAAVGELLNFLISALDARQADEGRSFFSQPGGGNRIGQKLFGDAVTLRCNPGNAELPSVPFTPEGLPLRPHTLIDQGTLSGLIYSRYWAHKQGKEATGNPSGLHLLGGQASTQELLRGVKRGVLITRLWYTRWLDPQSVLVTGLTRDGVFLIEDGAVTTPVNNFRFNDSPVTMLKNAEVLSAATVRVAHGPSELRVPALRTHDFYLSSVSEAV